MTAKCPWRTTLRMMADNNRIRVDLPSWGRAHLNALRTSTALTGLSVGERLGASLGVSVRDEDVLAASLTLGLFSRARDVQRHVHPDFRMEHDLHLVHAEHLDRLVERDLIAGDTDAAGRDRVRDI